MNFDQVEKYRVVRGNWSTRRGEHCGLFFIDYKRFPKNLKRFILNSNYDYKTKKLR